jgi:hypothetical protein
MLNLWNVFREIKSPRQIKTSFRIRFFFGFFRRRRIVERKKSRGEEYGAGIG